MIDRTEIDAMSEELGVHTSHVQRDYMFGWLLAGIFTQSELGRSLVLKGGNCLRKAYFPFGRFSGDLDFSAPGHIEETFLASELNRVCGFVQDRTGIEFDTTRTIARPKRGADDRLHVLEARVYFRNFYGEVSEMVIGVRMDVTQFDRLYLPVQTRHLIHAYSDAADCKAEIRCTKLEEQLASKLKCLLQRRHVADLFDFVATTVLSPDLAIDRREVLTTFLRKTIFEPSPGIAKGLFIDLPLAVFRDLWTKYIVCPIASRIDFTVASDAFRGMIETIFGTIPISQRQVEFFPAALRNPIMEAGHSLTLLAVTYDGVRRLVEPYSLTYKIRKDGVAREYFYVYDRVGGSSGPGIKAFVPSSVQRIENTDETFEPRYPVELAKAGEGREHFEGRPGPRAYFAVTRPKTPRRVHRSSGHRYRVRCSVCGKIFYRDTYTTRLNPHTDKYGNKCYGRMGSMI
jgi:predicted nucleotidyltransferase component of viral defense system